MTTTAQIAAKGCQSTGITEEMAETLHNNLGKTLVAVVELRADNRTENLKGDEKVSLSILTVEPAPNADTEAHLRELARAFHYERKLADGKHDQTLPMPGDSPEPQVSDVLAAGKALEPHEFVEAPDDSNLGHKVCDVCGEGENDISHDTKVREDYDATADDAGSSDEPPGLEDE